MPLIPIRAFAPCGQTLGRFPVFRPEEEIRRSPAVNQKAAAADAAAVRPHGEFGLRAEDDAGAENLFPVCPWRQKAQTNLEQIPDRPGRSTVQSRPQASPRRQSRAKNQARCGRAGQALRRRQMMPIELMKKRCFRSPWLCRITRPRWQGKGEDERLREKRISSSIDSMTS
nr:hypothetical protein [uncultured Ottowia sp.]